MSKPTRSEFTKTGAGVDLVGRLVHLVAQIATTPATQRKLPVDSSTRLYWGD